MREQNFIVMGQGRSRSIWPLDFSHCRFSSASDAQQSELRELDGLFSRFSAESTHGGAEGIPHA